MLNEAMTEVVLVKGWKKGARWSFPRGKINKDESDLDCAVREVYEETGYDIKTAGLADNPDRVHSIEVSMREQHMKLFVFRGVPMDTYFEPRTRKEISAINWYKLAELPTLKQMRAQQHGEGDTQQQSGKFYMVAPFLGPLKQWIKTQKKKDKLGISSTMVAALPTDDEAIADKAVSDVEAVTRRNEAQSDDHFSNLMANLKASGQQQEIASPQQQAQQADPAAALKRMLSVGQAPGPPMPLANMVSPPPAQPTTMPVNPLLDMLRGPVPTGPQSEGAQRYPTTPMEQVTGTPQHPQTPPHHNHIRSPPQMPPGFQQVPPSFPIPAQAQWQPQRPPQQPRNVQAAPQHPALIQQQQQQALPMPPRRSEHASQLLNLFRSNAREDSVHLKQPPPGIGGPSPGPGGPSQQPSMVPQASRLPPPSLNSHTMSLLSAFKSPPQKVVAPVQQLQHQVSELSASDTSPTMPSRRPYPTTAPIQHQAPQRLGPQQQNTLLDLFRAPSNSGQRPIQPVELATQSSPDPTLQNLLREHTKPSLGLQTSALRQPSPGNLTSATVTGPLHSPNLEMLRQQQPQPVEMGENTPVVPPHVYRPALDEALPQWPTPHGPAVPVLSPASNAPEITRQIAAPQPVPYQILQRPAILKSPQPEQVSSTSRSDSRSTIPSDQKNALLSLLTGTQGPPGQPQGLKPSPSGIMSPVSPLPGSNSKSLQSSPAAGDAKSRVSSITSIPGNIAGTNSSGGVGGQHHHHHHHQPPVSMIMTDYGLPMGHGEKQGPQMPYPQQQPHGKQAQPKMAGQGIQLPSGGSNSPVDKSVLLGFLRDVAKTG